jgi:hypothetical protein
MEFTEKEQKYLDFVGKKICAEVECFRYYYVVPWERKSMRYREMNVKNLNNYLTEKYGVTENYYPYFEKTMSKWFERQARNQMGERLNILFNRLN